MSIIQQGGWVTETRIIQGDSPGALGVPRWPQDDIERDLSISPQDTSFYYGQPERYGVDGIDDTQALKDAIAVASDFAGVGVVRLGKRVYYSNETLLINQSVIIEGVSPARNGSTGSVIQFADGISGIVVHGPETTCDADGTNQRKKSAETWPDGSTKMGRGTILKDFKVRRGAYQAGAPPADGTSHGIRFRDSAFVVRAGAENFAGNGFHLVADMIGTDDIFGNINLSALDFPHSRDNAGHGIFIDGRDANACNFRGANLQTVGGDGMFDSSFLGNTHIGHHSADVGGKNYRTDDANSRSIFIGAYAEDQEQGNAVSDRNIMLGGLMGDNNPDNGFYASILDDRAFIVQQLRMLTQGGGGGFKVMRMDNGPPTSGFFEVGSIVWNINAGPPDLWRCTVSGEPGTWEPKTL